MQLEFQQIKLSDILVHDRHRKEFAEEQKLADSIRSMGQLQPILVAPDLDTPGKFRLICGERRLRAVRLLEADEISAVVSTGSKSEFQYKRMELHENVKRKDFTWQEEVRAKEELHNLQQLKAGEAVKGHGGGWGQGDTAKELGVSMSSINQDLKLAKALKDNPELANAKTKHHAMKMIATLKEQAIARELAGRRKKMAQIHGFHNLDGLSGLASKVADATIDLVLVDPPFGVDRTATETEIWTRKDNYDDSSHTALGLIRDALHQYFRVLKENRHLYLFFDMEHYDELIRMCLDTGFIVFTAPIIWDKGSGSSAPQPYTFTRSYECILHCMKGKRELQKASFDVLRYKKVPPSIKIHPDEKPMALLQHLIEISTEYGEVVLDNFAGSASTLRAAISKHRSAIGFELNTTAYDKALVALNEAVQYHADSMEQPEGGGK